VARVDPGPAQQRLSACDPRWLEEVSGRGGRGRGAERDPGRRPRAAAKRHHMLDRITVESGAQRRSVVLGLALGSPPALRRTQTVSGVSARRSAVWSPP